MLRKYETLYILKPDSPPEATLEAVEKVKSVLDTQSAKLITMDVWGKKKLAYEVKKNQKGIFILATYLADPTVIRELERNLKIHSEVLKYLTVLLKSKVDVEKEMAQAKPFERNMFLTSDYAREHHEEDIGSHLSSIELDESDDEDLDKDEEISPEEEDEEVDSEIEEDEENEE